MTRLPRVYQSGRLGPGPLVLDAETSRRLTAVLRLREGDDFLVFSGDGREWAARVDGVVRGTVHALVGTLSRQEPAPARALEVCCGLVRPNRFEWAIEKCTEAGADVFRPLLATHGARGEAPSTERLRRWERIAVEASEQSGRLYLPAVQPPVQLADALARAKGSVMLCDPSGVDWSEAAGLLPASRPVTVLVGPEGGWSAAEVTAARARGALPVRLGPNVLRTETAAVAATVLLRAATATRS